MSFKFNPLIGKLDISGGSTFTGGTLTSSLDMGTNYIVMEASNGTRWNVFVADDGTLTTQQIVTGAGTPFGLLLAITNSA